MVQVSGNARQNDYSLNDDGRRFLVQSLGTEAYEILPLAGDASTRRYYRVVVEGQSSVLMSCGS